MIEKYYSFTEPKLKGKALFLKAYMLDKGIGGSCDKDAAINLYKEAMNLKDTDAMCHYARLCTTSPHTNIKEAEYWFRKAINQGKNPVAMTGLAELYHYGNGVEQNLLEASRLYDLAIERGNVDAMLKRATIYHDRKDYKNAALLYDQAIELGNTDAMVQRALMHLKGEGYKKNIIEAFFLLKNAHKLGNTSAHDYMVSYQEKISPEILHEANKDKYVKEFKWLLTQLQEIQRDLAKKNHSYKKVADSVESLHKELDSELKKFIAEPTQSNYATLQTNCLKAIEVTEKESAQHRGWHKVNPIIRAMIGVLVSIVVIPALLIESSVEVTNPIENYKKVFLDTPKTKTEKKIGDFKTTYNKITDTYKEQKEEFDQAPSETNLKK